MDRAYFQTWWIARLNLGRDDKKKNVQRKATIIIYKTNNR